MHDEKLYRQLNDLNLHMIKLDHSVDTVFQYCLGIVLLLAALVIIGCIALISL